MPLLLQTLPPLCHACQGRINVVLSCHERAYTGLLMFIHLLFDPHTLPYNMRMVAIVRSWDVRGLLASGPVLLPKCSWVRHKCDVTQAQHETCACTCTLHCL